MSSTQRSNIKTNGCDFMEIKQLYVKVYPTLGEKDHFKTPEDIFNYLSDKLGLNPKLRYPIGIGSIRIQKDKEGEKYVIFEIGKKDISRVDGVLSELLNNYGVSSEIREHGGIFRAYGKRKTGQKKEYKYNNNRKKDPENFDYAKKIKAAVNNLRGKS